MKNKYTLLLFFAAFCCMGVQCKEKEEEKGPVLAEELAKGPKETTGGYKTFRLPFEWVGMANRCKEYDRDCNKILHL